MEESRSQAQTHRRFRDALDEVIGAGCGRPAAELVAFHRSNEPRLLAFALTPADRLEYRKRFNESLLASLCECGVAPETTRAAEEAFDELKRLGFARLEREVTMTVIYARCLYASRSFGTAVELIDALRPRLKSQILPGAEWAECHRRQLDLINRLVKEWSSERDREQSADF